MFSYAALAIGVAMNIAGNSDGGSCGGDFCCSSSDSGSSGDEYFGSGNIAIGSSTLAWALIFILSLLGLTDWFGSFCNWFSREILNKRRCTVGDGDLSNYTYVVCTKSMLAGRGDFVPLSDIFDSEEWRRECNKMDNVLDLFLVRLSLADFLTLRNAEVLSYRWGKEVKIKCKVNPPEPTGTDDERIVDIPSNIFSILEGVKDSYLWVDFLSHLNHPTHRRAIMNKMGLLYANGKVKTMYLEEYCNQIAGDSDHNELKKEKVLTSLRRGWIQQEISFGELSVDIVRKYFNECIQNNDYYLIAALIRRRPNVVSWLANGLDSHSCTFLHNATDDLEFSKNGRDLWFNFQRSVSRFFEGSPTQYTPGYEEDLTVTSFVTDMLYKYLKDRNEIKVEEKSSVMSTEDQMQEYVRLNGHTIFEPLITDLANRVCKKQDFDLTHLFSAYQLIRSFLESALTYEEDCYSAMTQCAALTNSSVKWTDDRTSGAATLQIAWKTLAHHVMCSHDDFICNFGIRRKEARDKVAGLLSLIPLLEKKRDEDFLIIIKKYPFPEFVNSSMHNMCLLFKSKVLHVFNDKIGLYGLTPSLTVSSIVELF